LTLRAALPEPSRRFYDGFTYQLAITQNNSAENIATHYLSFVEGATGKDERLNEDTNSSKVAVSAD
jgi:hypothetical protein